MLDDLRKKPAYVKESYAFWGALLVTMIIAAVWIFSLPIRLGEVSVQLEPEDVEETSGAFSQFWGEFKDSATVLLQAGKEGEGEEGDFATSTEEETVEPQSLEMESEESLPATTPVILIATSSASKR